MPHKKSAPRCYRVLNESPQVCSLQGFFFAITPRLFQYNAQSCVFSAREVGISRPNCYNQRLDAPIAQMDRVLGYEPRGRGFESCWAHHKFKGLSKDRPFFMGANIVELAPPCLKRKSLGLLCRQGIFARRTCDRFGLEYASPSKNQELHKQLDLHIGIGWHRGELDTHQKAPL